MIDSNRRLVDDNEEGIINDTKEKDDGRGGIRLQSLSSYGDVDMWIWGIWGIWE